MLHANAMCVGGIGKVSVVMRVWAPLSSVERVSKLCVRYFVFGRYLFRRQIAVLVRSEPTETTLRPWPARASRVQPVDSPAQVRMVAGLVAACCYQC